MPPRKRPGTRGRPPADLRRVLNAVLYQLRAGGAWRLMPHDFGPWQTVYHYFRKWKREKQWEHIHNVLRAQVRAQEGKRCQPTGAILDSQTVRSADHAGEKGFDAGKKTTGRKRHILVDTLGLLLWVCVTPANVSEQAGARTLLDQALSWMRWLQCIWADRGYAGEAFADWVASHRVTGTLRLEIVKPAPGQRGFAVQAKRWIVERTFGWFMKQRRLVRDYETKTEHAEAWIYIAMISVMLRRLA